MTPLDPLLSVLDIGAQYSALIRELQAPPPPPAPRRIPLGLHCDFTYGDLGSVAAGVKALKNLKASVSRNSLLWSHIELAKGTRDYSVTDGVVEDLRFAGIDPLMVVVGSPMWANGSPDRFYVPQDAQGFTTWVSHYADFLSETATRYKGKVKRWELWNEENEHYFWKPSPSAAMYAAWYRAARAAIRGADPQARIAIGGLTGLTFVGGSGDVTGRDFLKQLFGFGLDYEAVALHPYGKNAPDVITPWENNFEDIGVIVSALAGIGNAGCPLWCTEWGWSAGAVGEALQAQYLSRSVQLLKTYPSVELGTVFNLEDTGAYDYGMYKAGFVPRPAAASFASFGGQA